MPLTWFAHQAPVMGLKLARPRWFDATALCVGSMMPDLMYSFSAYVHIDTHEWPAFTIGVPLTLVLATVIRFVLAPLAPTQLADLGPLRLRSYGVLATRRPALLITIVSATIGVASHVVLDWFTHPGRPGVRWLGYDDVDVTVAGHTEPLAGVFQMVGHSLGSLLGVGLLLVIGRRRLLEHWYGREAVDRVRAQAPDRRERVRFWAIVAAGLLAGVWWGWGGDRLEWIQRPFVGMVLGACGGAVVIRGGTRHVRTEIDRLTI